MKKNLIRLISLVLFICTVTISLTSCQNAEGQIDIMQTLIFAGLGVAMIAVFFFMSRGNKKREKETERMRNEIEPGDEVTTIGGIVGRVVSVSEKTLVIETSREKTHIRFLKSAIKSVDVKANAEIPEAIEAPAETEEATESPSDEKKK